MSEPLLLEDGRSRDGRGAVFVDGEWMQPLHCGSCHKQQGLVSASATFAFWLCRDCETKHGHIEGVYAVPDAVFYQQAREEQLEKYGRLLSPKELLDVVDANSSPLATLLNEGRPREGAP